MILAVHISDGVLRDPVWVGGLVAAAGLIVWSAWRVRDSEVPRLGVLTAAFFVASQIHLRLGPTSVHLLLNGLLGVVLGRRSPLAIAVGLLLQSLLFEHGGKTTLGVNVVVYSLPSLIAGLAFPGVRTLRWLSGRWPRLAAVSLAAFIWAVTAGIALQTLWVLLPPTITPFPTAASEWWVTRPEVVACLLAGCLGLAWNERRLEADPNFPLGLLLGSATAYATVGLNCLVLWAGGKEEVRDLAGVVVLAHLPVVVVESVGVGFVVAFLAKAKPEWLAGHSFSGNTSSNGTSH